MAFRILVSIFASIMISGCDRTAGYGLCIISAQKEAGVNSGNFFPMHSVMKFPQALYVADYLQRNDIPLDSAVAVFVPHPQSQTDLSEIVKQKMGELE